MADNISALVTTGTNAVSATPRTTTGRTNDVNHADGESPKGTYPETGTQARFTPKTRTAISASQKLGRPRPRTASTSANRPIVPPRIAATAPEVTPSTITRSRAPTANDSVTGIREEMASDTGNPEVIDVPRSPEIALRS